MATDSGLSKIWSHFEATKIILIMPWTATTVFPIVTVTFEQAAGKMVMLVMVPTVGKGSFVYLKLFRLLFVSLKRPIYVLTV